MANATNENFLLEYKHQFYTFMNKELVFDEEVDSWFLMSSSFPILGIVAVYLLFVLKIGPDYMKKREPYSLKTIMLLYNIFQTLFNACLLFVLFSTPGALSQIWSYWCHPLERSENIIMIRALNKGSWYFLLSKVIDLLDTIFFVLRKKQSQVTFLHVFHHANMVITCWAYLRFIKGEQAIVPAALNAFIHTVMYFYYFLAALGPQMQPYLWWKKYLTKMQIIQFLMILSWFIGLGYFNCRVSKLYVYYMCVDVAVFLYLFSLFYKKTYKKISKTEKTN